MTCQHTSYQTSLFVPLKDEFKPLNGFFAVRYRLYLRTNKYLTWNVGDRIVKMWYFSKSFGESFLRFKNPKVFVIERNETGTMTLYNVLFYLGSRMGNQQQAEWMIEHWGVLDFRDLDRQSNVAERNRNRLLPQSSK